MQKLRDRLNKISLKIQLGVLVVTTFTIIILLIIIYNYQSNSKAITDNQIYLSTTLLQSETQNLDAYLSEISRYSLLLRHDEAFMHTINTKKPMDYFEQTSISTLLRNNYYSRNDLLSYRLYLLRKSENYEINSTNHKVQTFYHNSVEDLPGYEDFTKGRYYRSIYASDDAETFITYYRTIIRIEDQEPLAIVELSFDTSFIDSLIAPHQASYDLFYIFNEDHSLLYTNNLSSLAETNPSACLEEIEKTNENHFIMDINLEKYIGVYNESQAHGYILLHLKKLSELDRQLAETRNISLLIGFITIFITTALVIVFIQFVTKPLSTLAHRLRRVGSGNFTTTTDINGSLEITNLAENFNSMIYQIDELIKKNYISQLNEKTAQLIALEAQINPHFLYNTLQAISAEAIVNHQDKINDMITALASMLRYTIKSKDLVFLNQEIKHVNDYLLLQQARFEERLSYELMIDSNTNKLLIPKISIQALVENSIIHGVSGEVTNIHISINARLREDYLIIHVIDDGNGIKETILKNLNSQFLNPKHTSHQNSEIGLMNLHNRLQLLYNGKASLTILSSKGHGTIVILKIPITKEVHDV